MTAVKTDEEALKIAEAYNVGDLSLGNTPNIRRQDVVNKAKLQGNVFPNEVINRNNPDKNYQFAWAPLGDAKEDREFVADLRDDGYKPVTESEWILNREAWEWIDTPERYKPRWGVSRLLLNGRDEFLMYRDQSAFDAQRKARAEYNDRRIQATHEESINTAMAHGVPVEGRIAGQDYKVDAPKRRTSIN